MSLLINQSFKSQSCASEWFDVYLSDEALFGDRVASELWEYIPDEEILVKYDDAMGVYLK